MRLPATRDRRGGSRRPKVARMRGPGEARLVASGALLQQLAQGTGLLALLVIVTLLARRLTSRSWRLRPGGLAVRLSAGAPQQRGQRRGAGDGRGRPSREERARVFAAARRSVPLVGVATGVLIAVVAVVDRGDGARRRARERRPDRRHRARRAHGGRDRGEREPRRACARSGCSRRRRARRSPRVALYLVADGHADPGRRGSGADHRPQRRAAAASGSICAGLSCALGLPFQLSARRGEPPHAPRSSHRRAGCSWSSCRTW